MPDSQLRKELFQSSWIGWLCRAGHYSLGLSQLCPIGAVLCVDDSPAHDLIEQREGIPFFSVERQTRRRHEASDSEADSILPLYRAQLEELVRRAQGRRRVLASSMSCRTLSEFAADAGCESISNPPELTHWLNDKRNLLAALRQMGLPTIRGQWIRLSESRYSEHSAAMGPALVAQLAHGTSGSGTVFIRSAAEYESAGRRFGDDIVWVAPDLGQLSMNINALALESGTVVSYPSVQLEGLSIVNASRGMYCGNDYVSTADLPSGAISEVVEQTARIGRWLASLNYRGLFGLDFVLSPESGRAYAVDLNPRWQGSTAPLTLAECKVGRFPLAVAELASRMGLIGDAELLRGAGDYLQPVRAAHLSLRCPDSGWSRVTGALQPGVYALSPEPVFARAGFRLSDLGSPDEILVAGGVPRPGTLLAPKSHAMRFSTEQRIMDVSSRSPLPRSGIAAQRLYQLLGLEPVEAE